MNSICRQKNFHCPLTQRAGNIRCDSESVIMEMSAYFRETKEAEKVRERGGEGRGGKAVGGRVDRSGRRYVSLQQEASVFWTVQYTLTKQTLINDQGEADSSATEGSTMCAIPTRKEVQHTMHQLGTEHQVAMPRYCTRGLWARFGNDLKP